MRNVYVVADNIFSPLGKNSLANIEALKQGRSGIKRHAADISPDLFYAALFDPEDKIADESRTFFEEIALASALDALQKVPANLLLPDNKTGFILSTTKGNISLIENLPDSSFPENRLSLNTSASIVARELGIDSEPLVVSHACISGLLAIITGMRLIQSGLYDNLTTLSLPAPT
jgi:3-oxoacyl-[acyl-carrier-protein] synthase-1